MKKFRVLAFVLVMMVAAAVSAHAYGEECNDGHNYCTGNCYDFGPPAPGCLQRCNDEYWSCMNDEDRPYCPTIYYCPRETFTVPPGDKG